VPTCKSNGALSTPPAEASLALGWRLAEAFGRSPVWIRSPVALASVLAVSAILTSISGSMRGRIVRSSTATLHASHLGRNATHRDSCLLKTGMLPNVCEAIPSLVSTPRTALTLRFPAHAPERSRPSPKRFSLIFGFGTGQGRHGGRLIVPDPFEPGWSQPSLGSSMTSAPTTSPGAVRMAWPCQMRFLYAEAIDCDLAARRQRTLCCGYPGGANCVGDFYWRRA
jgi:hypothetical protein